MKPELTIVYSATLPYDFFSEFRKGFADEELQLELKSRVVGPTMGVDWLLSAAVIVLLTKPFLDAILKRAADDVADSVYPRIKSSVSQLATKVLVGTRDTWMKVTSSGPKSRTGRSSFFSVESETRDGTEVRFVFNETDDPVNCEKAVIQVFAILEAHHSGSPVDPFVNAPVDEARNTIYMIYNDETRCWQAIDLSEELHRIARESRERQKNASDLKQ